MDYKRTYFDPAAAGAVAVGKPDTEALAFRWTEEGRNEAYVFSGRTTLAVNVAIASGRPLLVLGEPGSGKTRLAAAVAQILKRQFYARTVTSRTQANDLLYTFDGLRRLNDAATPGLELRSDQSYVEPGVLWWGFGPGTAVQRGNRALESRSEPAEDPAFAASDTGAIVLIDEIDKADPDVPNDLLEPFDTRRFLVKETNDRIAAERNVFLVVTSNNERELPPAFVRRCVMLVLDEPNSDWFEWVAGQHFPDLDKALRVGVATEVQRLRSTTRPGTRKPSTAEYIDALRVCRQLSVEVGSKLWPDIVQAVLVKSDQLPSARP